MLTPPAGDGRGSYSGGDGSETYGGGDANVKPITCVSLAGWVWRMAVNGEGCRLLQEVIERAETDQERVKLANELKGHVWEAIDHKWANHVLQKFIVMMTPKYSQFVIDEVMSKHRGANIAARHRYGCRVIERLLEHCSPDQLKPMVEEILEDGADLCRHLYGNFVVQHLFEYGSPEQQHHLAQVVQARVRFVCNHAPAVVSKALLFGTCEDRMAVARALLKERGLVISIARKRHGHDVVMHLFDVLDKHERESVRRLIKDSMEELSRTRYGRATAKDLGLPIPPKKCLDNLILETEALGNAPPPQERSGRKESGSGRSTGRAGEPREAYRAASEAGSSQRPEYARLRCRRCQALIPCGCSQRGQARIPSCQ